MNRQRMRLPHSRAKHASSIFRAILREIAILRPAIGGEGFRRSFLIDRYLFEFHGKCVRTRSKVQIPSHGQPPPGWWQTISCDVAGAQKAVGVFEKGPKAGTPEMETEPMNTNIIQSWIAESERMLRSGRAQHGLKTRVTVQLCSLSASIGVYLWRFRHAPVVSMNLRTAYGSFLLPLVVLAGTASGVELGVDRAQFTIDGKPVFLLGCSQRSALRARAGEQWSS